MKNFTSRIILCLLSIFPAIAFGQNLIQNGNFNASAAGWTTSCTSIEAYAFETTYGGTDPTNHVAEIDDEACMHQDVCVIPGSTYAFSMDASRRNIAPATVTTHINIIGLDASGATVATYINMDFSRSNTVFALTPVTGIPTFTIPTASSVVRLRVTLTDNTTGYSTLGMIVDNISLTFTTSPLVTGPTTSCVNAPITFGVSGLPASGITYSWAFGADATPTTSTASGPSASWSTGGTKTVTVSFSNGVCYAETLSYTVVVAPAATATMSPTICDGDTFSYHGNNYTTSGDYHVNFTSAGGCDSTVTIHLMVNPIPAAPAAPSPTYCQFDLASPIGAVGSSLTWYGPGVTAGYTIPPAVSTATAGTTSYYVTQTVAGCTSDSTHITVTVNPKPVPPTVRDTTYCQNATAGPLTATGTGLHWYTSSAGSAYTTTAPIPATSYVGTNSWFVSQVVGGCESDKALLNVTVVPKPSFQIGSLKTSICLHDTLDLFYSGTSNVVAYSWGIPSGTAVINGWLTTPGISLAFNTAGNQLITLSASSLENGCTAIESILIKVETPPVATVSTPSSICLGDSVLMAIGDHSDNADTFVWYIDNTLLASSTDLNIITQRANSGGPYLISWNTAGIHTIQLYAQSKAGCRSAIMIDTVKVGTAPDATFAVMAKSTLCLEDSVLFKANTVNQNNMYVWSPSHSFNQINQPTAWGRMEEARSLVTLTVTDPFGCSASTTQELDPDACCKAFFPTAFSPNGDGRNDHFYPVFSGFHRFHDFVVTNRWGQKVFESTNSDGQWDGTYNGEPQDMGVYYFYLRYDCGGNTILAKGDVTLVR